MSTSTAEADIASLCGAGFLSGQSGAGAVSQGTTASFAMSPKNTAGHVSEDTVIADFNKDGIPDSAVLSGDGIYVTLLGLNGTKLSSTSYPVPNVGVAQNIITADFNGDGPPDLAVTQGIFSTSVNPFPTGNVGILLGKPDGTFGPVVSFAVGPVGNSYLVSGDFNGDGVADLAFTHMVATGSGQVGVMLGKGNGTFGPVVNYPVGPDPFTLVTADFTGDGKLDLVALDAFDAVRKVWVLPGRGDGTFQTAVSSLSLTQEGFLGYADLNHDGNLDLIIADQPASAMEVMMGNGNGTFQPGKEYLLGPHPTSVAIPQHVFGDQSAEFHFGCRL